MNYSESTHIFTCCEQALLGILSQPATSATPATSGLSSAKPAGKTGVLFIVGGPQYRTGSHRQFVLMARHLAAAGIPVMRFDYRGMGDSAGKARDFTNIQQDIHAALEVFFQQVEGMREVVLWGLCDAATAAAFYAFQDTRVSGLLLLNPWVRTEAGVAKAYLKHYYLQRLSELNFWKKLILGQMNVWTAGFSLMQKISNFTFQDKALSKHSYASNSDFLLQEGLPLPEKMLKSLEFFQGRIAFILCENDLTAQEFSDATQSSQEWKKLLTDPRVSMYQIADANHTFSRRIWRDAVQARMIEWLGQR